MTRVDADGDSWGTRDEPQVQLIAWRGPVSALAARLRQDPETLLRQIRAVGVTRGKKDYSIEVSTPGAIGAARRLLARAGADE